MDESKKKPFSITVSATTLFIFFIVLAILVVIAIPSGPPM